MKFFHSVLFRYPSPSNGQKTSFLKSLTCSHASFFSSEAKSSPLRLPLITKLNEQALRLGNPSPLKNTSMIVVTHAFPTISPLLESFVQLGAKRHKIFVMGKLYSACEDSIQEIMQAGFRFQRSSVPTTLGGFQRSFIRDVNALLTACITEIPPEDNLIILDHGGHTLAFTPPELIRGRKVIGVEKTTAGLMHPETAGLPFPIIRMADCAVKTILEPPLIAEEIVQKLIPLIPIQKSGLICGVVGYGSVGKAVADKLLSLGHKVMVYDHVPEKIQFLKKGLTKMPNLSTLVANSEYILDCTGDDISVSTEILDVTNANKILISCSSEDKAFRTLLHFIQSKHHKILTKNPLNEISFINEMGCLIRILRGGFPINFDNIAEAAPPKDIQITRGLALASVLQAIEFFDKPELLLTSGSYMLDPELQKFLANEWLKFQPKNRFSEEIIQGFQNIDWIAKKSGGKLEPCPVFQELEKTSHSPAVSFSL